MSRTPLSDAECEAQTARIQALAEKWITPLGLKWWQNIAIEYLNETNKKDDEDVRRPFSCLYSWCYLDGAIMCYLPTIEELDDCELEVLFLHELCHLLISEISECREDHELHLERVATQLAMGFRWVRQAGYEEGKADGEDHRERA